LISRENELLNIENIFKTGQFCCIEGAAGVGKSSLARQFYLTRQSKSQMKWIDADCFEKILFNFKLILSQLNITIECKSKFDFFDKLKINLNEYAAVNKKKFLFIIDNLIDEQDIELLMFGFDKSHFQFIITTQKNISEIPKIELKLATKEDCRKAGLHERILNTNNNNNNAFSLVRLSRMATFKNEIPKTDVNVVCFNNLIKQECLKASDFLNCLAYLDGNYNISLDLVRNLFLDTDANEFASALNYLIKGNILISSDQRFSLHSLIQAELIGDALRKNSSHLDRIVLVLNSLLNYSQIESNDLPAIEILFKQAKKVLKEDWKTKSKNKNCAELFYKIGLFYDTILFEYSEALDNYKESLLIYKQLKPLDYSQIDNVLGRIGNDYMRLDLNEEAVVAYREILPRHKSPGILNTLASVHEKLKQNNEALEIYKEAIDLLLKEENSPSTSEEICNTFSKIGSIYLNQKEYQEALVNFKQVLKIRKETLNSNHPSIAKCLSEIANINYHLGKYEDALKAFKEALRINKESLPGNHADLAHIMNVIGNIHFNMGQLEDALKNYKEAIRIKKETGSQAAVAMILNNIGLVYSRMEKYDDALTSLKESLSIKQREFAENHLSIANTLNNMGNAYFKLKQTDEALKCYTQAFTIFSERSPCSYASKADTLANLGDLVLFID
jgi:tetratricopeptide (TPR) repeat protein